MEQPGQLSINPASALATIIKTPKPSFHPVLQATLPKKAPQMAAAKIRVVWQSALLDFQATKPASGHEPVAGHTV